MLSVKEIESELLYEKKTADIEQNTAAICYFAIHYFYKQNFLYP